MSSCKGEKIFAVRGRMGGLVWLLSLLRGVGCSVHHVWERDRAWRLATTHAVVHVSVDIETPSYQDRLLAYDGNGCNVSLLGSSFEYRRLETGEPYFETHVFTNASAQPLCLWFYSAKDGSLRRIHLDGVSIVVSGDVYPEEMLGRPLPNGTRRGHLGEAIVAVSTPAGAPPLPPSSPSPSGGQWCVQCLEGDQVRNPFCEDAAVCSVSNIEAVARLLRSLNDTSNERSTWSRATDARVQACVSRLEYPSTILTQADIVTYARASISMAPLAC